MLAALLVRVGVTLVIGDNNRPYYEYMTIAQNLLDGNGYSWDEWGRAPLQPTSFLPPVYVYWCALFMSLFHGQYVWMYVCQAVIAASGCLPAFLAGQRLFRSEKVGLSFAVLYALYPEFVFLHSRPVTEFLYVVLALWIVYVYLLIRDSDLRTRRTLRLAVGLGLLGGFTVLVKESATILIAAMLLAMAWRFRPWGALLTRVYAPMAIAACIIMSPWIVRNLVVQGEFIPVRTGYGLTSWIANHPGATGTDKTLSGAYVMSDLEPSTKARLDSILPTDEQDRDRVYRSEVKRFILERPGEYLALSAKRLQYFLWFDETHPLAHSFVYRLSYILLLLFALPGIVLAWRRKMLDPILVFGILGFVVLYVPVLVLPRYRIIPVLFLLLLAAYFASEMWSKLTGGHSASQREPRNGREDLNVPVSG